jgi:hypothetical protein
LIICALIVGRRLLRTASGISPAVSSWGAGHDHPGRMYVSVLAERFNGRVGLKTKPPSGI